MPITFAASFCFGNFSCASVLPLVAPLYIENVVHGDITTDNLLVAASGIVKIGDFSVNQVVKIVNNPLYIPNGMNPLLKNLIEGFFYKVPIGCSTKFLYDDLFS
ncbi:serine/threonine-protein kinase GRIK2-like isoform X2 [Coffea arabica]|uniref:Serine/threonine-protein kinase GRIK2-like isoform X2 n=1 Tax=Coffea arabica TaxID=13443 RepID=A0ABM4VS56_COFAR